VKALVELQKTGQAIEIDTAARSGDIVSVMLRPERIELSSEPVEGGNVLSGTIVASSFIGMAVDYTVELADGVRLRVIASPEIQYARGAPVWLTVREGQGLGHSTAMRHDD
jgi:ABC-type Fe3+/spermidine/putrescine transport system ATPase subunit